MISVFALILIVHVAKATCMGPAGIILPSFELRAIGPEPWSTAQQFHESPPFGKNLDNIPLPSMDNQLIQISPATPVHPQVVSTSTLSPSAHEDLSHNNVTNAVHDLLDAFGLSQAEPSPSGRSVEDFDFSGPTYGEYHHGGYWAHPNHGGYDGPQRESYGLPYAHHGYYDAPPLVHFQPPPPPLPVHFQPAPIHLQPIQTSPNFLPLLNLGDTSAFGKLPNLPSLGSLTDASSGGINKLQSIISLIRTLLNRGTSSTATAGLSGLGMAGLLQSFLSSKSGLKSLLGRLAVPLLVLLVVNGALLLLTWWLWTDCPQQSTAAPMPQQLPQAIAIPAPVFAPVVAPKPYPTYGY